MNTSDLIKVLLSGVSLISSAGPWGLGALVLSGGGLFFVIRYLIKEWNKRVDQNDMDRAGSDAGLSAVDLRNQAQSVNEKLDELSKNSQ